MHNKISSCCASTHWLVEAREHTKHNDVVQNIALNPTDPFCAFLQCNLMQNPSPDAGCSKHLVSGKGSFCWKKAPLIVEWIHGIQHTVLERRKEEKDEQEERFSASYNISFGPKFLLNSGITEPAYLFRGAIVYRNLL